MVTVLNIRLTLDGMSYLIGSGMLEIFFFPWYGWHRGPGGGNKRKKVSYLRTSIPAFFILGICSAR